MVVGPAVVQSWRRIRDLIFRPPIFGLKGNQMVIRGQFLTAPAGSPLFPHRTIHLPEPPVEWGQGGRTECGQ